MSLGAPSTGTVTAATVQGNDAASSIPRIIPAILKSQGQRGKKGGTFSQCWDRQEKEKKKEREKKGEGRTEASPPSLPSYTH